MIPYSVGSPEMRDQRIYDLANRSRTDGLMIISMPINDQQTERLLKNQMPVVLIDSHRSEFSRVIVDDTEGGRLATQHLIDLGHTKIAFLSSHLENPLQFSSTLERYHGYCNALELAGIPVNPAYQIEGEHGRKEAEEMALKLLALDDPPTAIFASSDSKAVGVLDAAKKKGIKVPEELSIIGYDNIRDAEFLELTTIQQPLFKSGVLGCETLLSMIDQPDQEIEEIILPVELIARKTTSPPSR
jgi:DNA-binding LacI/PurR family transcriptional regulator